MDNDGDMDIVSASSGDNTIFIGRYAGGTTKGDDNIEIVTDGANPSIIGVNSNKLHIQNVIVGDTSAKKLAIGNVGASDLSPDATLEVKTNTNSDIGFIVQGATSQLANLTEWQDSSENILASIDNGGNASFANLTTTGNLNVSGTLTYIDSTTVTIADKQLELASNSGTAAGNDAAVNDGGIVVKSTEGDKKWTWLDATDAWHSTENISLASSKSLNFGDGTAQTTAFTGAGVTIGSTTFSCSSTQAQAPLSSLSISSGLNLKSGVDENFIIRFTTV